MMTQYVCKPQVIEENLLLEATGVNLGAQKQFWNAVSAWVAQAQFGSRSPGGSRRLKLGRAALKPLLRPSKT